MIGLAKYLFTVPKYQVRLLCYRKGYDFYEPLLKDLGIDYVFDWSSTKRFHGLWALRRQVKKFKPDLIISFLGENNIFSCLNHLVCNTPLIVSERNTTVSPTLVDRIRFLLYRKAECIVPNSHSQCEYLCNNHKAIASKVHTVVNFVDTDNFVPINSEKENTIKRILTVARVVPQKNVLNFIHAVKKAKSMSNGGFYIDWYGSLNDTVYVEKCRKLIEEMDVGDVIQLKGENNDIKHEYQSSDAFCLPSYVEGTPNVICEAMSCGLPILCSDICDNRIYIKDSENGFLFNPNDMDSIAMGIVKFINTSAKIITDMKINSRKQAVKSFSVTHFNEQWQLVIDDVTRK